MEEIVMKFIEKIFPSFLFIGVTLCTDPAMALVDAEVFYGSLTSDITYTSNGQRKTTTSPGFEAGASVLIKPLPIIPLSIGATVSQSSTDFSKIAKIMAADTAADPMFDGFSTDASAMSRTLFYGPVVKLWVPIPKISPYVKAAYLVGTETLDTNFSLTSPATATTPLTFELKSKTIYSHTATNLAAGISYSPIKFTDIFVEYSMHSGKRKAISASGSSTSTSGDQVATTPIVTGDIPEADKKNVDANATSIRFGLSIGI